jgi:hypothetical protein
MNRPFRFGTTAWGVEQSRNTSDEPAAITGSMTAKIMGEDAAQIGATITMTAFGSFLGCYKWSITLTAPDFLVGRVYEVLVEYVQGGRNIRSLHTFQVT